MSPERIREGEGGKYGNLVRINEGGAKEGLISCSEPSH